jgi:hypothetical protein
MTADELKKFTDALNKAEKASPTKTKTTSHSGGSNSTTSGGMDESQFAKDYAQQNPEYASYQKATTYFDAMASALRGVAGGSL